MNVYENMVFCLFLLIGQNLFTHDVKDYMNLSNKGLVIVLHGTTSAGKTSIRACLEVLLRDNNVFVVSIDDFLWKFVIEEARLLGFVDENMSLDEIQKIIMTNRDLIFAKFKENNWIEPKKELHRAVRKLAIEGKLVLLDTVHGDDTDYADFSEQMKDVNVIGCQIYCSPSALAQHVVQRNRLVGYAEKRDVTFTLQQYCRLYQLAQSSDIIDRISINDVQESLEILYQDLQLSMSHDLAQKKIDETKHLYTQVFDLQNSNDVVISSKYPYDIVVNTGKDTPEKCAFQIYDEIKYLME